MFRCSQLTNVTLALRENKLPAEWNEILSHKSVFVEDAPEEILRYLHGGVMRECAVCPDAFVSVEAKQIPAALLKNTRHIIRSRNETSRLPLISCEKKAG